METSLILCLVALLYLTPTVLKIPVLKKNKKETGAYFLSEKGKVFSKNEKTGNILNLNSALGFWLNLFIGVALLLGGIIMYILVKIN